MAELTKRQKYDLLKLQLSNERSSFISHWRDLNDYILPRRGRFFVQDVNKGDRRTNKIVDSTATFAAGILRAGMMSGVTSPARPWFRLSLPDTKMAEHGPIKEWLHQVTQVMSTSFLKSGLYHVLPTAYGDLGVFATAAIYMEQDFQRVARFQSLPIGSYMIAKDDKGKINTFFREFRLTVRQLVEKFGKKVNGKWDWSNFSDHVKSAYERGEYQTWVDVCHVIQPNDNYDEKKNHSKFKKFASCYYEASTTQHNKSDDNKVLLEQGYNKFPVLVPRWQVTGEDVYGTDCPGMTTLGDIRALQLMHKRKAEAIEKMVRPPMTGPTSLRNSKASILPGDITFIDIREGQQGFRPAHEVNLRIQELMLDIQDHQGRIKKGFYEDLFLMLASSDRRDITAREIDERHEEKLLALGPVLEQLNEDLLEPLIDNTFSYLVEMDMGSESYLPQAPEEIQEMDLKVEYISIMAQAQKLVGISGMERAAGMIGQLAAFDPRVLHKFDSDQYMDVYGDQLSLPPGIIRSDEAVASIRAAEQQAQQQQAQVEMAAQATQAAKNLSQSDMEGDNALTRIAGGG